MAAVAIVLPAAFCLNGARRFGTVLELIASLWTLWRINPVLRRRAGYQAALFAAFSLFWTAAPLIPAGRAFGFSQRGIALFRAGRCLRSARRTCRRSSCGPRLEPPLHGCGHYAGRLRLCHGSYRRLRLAAGVGGCVCDAGCGSAREPGVRSARHLCAERRTSQPAEWVVYGEVICRRRSGISGRERIVCARRLAVGVLSGRRGSARRSDAFRHRTV